MRNQATIEATPQSQSTRGQPQTIQPSEGSPSWDQPFNTCQVCARACQEPDTANRSTGASEIESHD